MISLTLSILLLLTQFPVLAINTIILLLSISLLTVGAERVASGIVLIRSNSSLPESTIRLSTRSKKVTPYTNVILGGVAILFAVIALVSPQFISEISLHLLSIAISVMFNGLARITQGALDASQPKWLRAFSIGIGALSIVASVFATNSKLFGIVFPIRILFVVLLIYGIGMIVYGATGRSSVEEILKKKFNKSSDR
jgi:uncharacterized membrane protein HdeD (DUF308 family)